MAQKGRGRPTVNKLLPRFDATPHQVAQLFLRTPPDREWEYQKNGGADYKCVDCGRSTHYPEKLYEDGRCSTCRTP